MVGMGVSFLGFSATIASVVIKRPAIDDPIARSRISSRSLQKPITAYLFLHAH
jgi:hypothetical protein